MLLLRVKPRPRVRPRRRFAWPEFGMPDVYRVMGGTDGRGFFGNQALGGAISAPVVTTFPSVIPGGSGLVVFQTLYNITPSDASLFALAGASNTLTLTPGAQRAHNAAGSNDNSVTFYHAVLANDCTSCTFDASSLPAGDDGRYGQMAFYIVRYPDTVNGFFAGTPVTNTQTSTTSVNPGTITLPTNKCLELFGAATRGHANDLLPVVESPDEWPEYLKHVYFDFVPQPTADYPAAFQNSIIASGAVAGRVNTAGGTSTPVWTFTGSSPSTGSAHSVLVAYNILGGTSAGTDIAPAAAQLSLSGTAPSRFVQHLAAPAVAALLLSTAAPTVSVTANQSVAPAVAQLTLSATAPSALQAHLPAPSAGQLALSATAPTRFVAHLAAPSAVQLSLSTVAPSAMQEHLSSPSAGQLTLSGHAPSLQATFSISPATAQLTLTSTAPTRTEDHRPVPTSAQLTLTTTAPSLGNQINITPDGGQLALSTTAPARFVAHLLLPTHGDLALSTTSPVALQDHRPSPAAASLTVSTTAPAVTSGFRPDIGAGTLTLSTTAPTVRQEHFSSPAAAQLVLSGFAPVFVTPPEYAVVAFSNVTLTFATLTNVTLEPTS